MKRLIISTIPNDFDAAIDVPLGPWCFMGKEDSYPEWDQIHFPLDDPLASPESLDKAEQLTSEYANSLVPKLTYDLNKLNNTEYSQKFWRLIIFPWLMSLIHVCYDRELCIRQFIQNNKNESFQVDLLSHSIQWNFASYFDWMETGGLNPTYNGWLFSRILEQMAPSSWKVSYKKIDDFIISNTLSPALLPKSIKQKIVEELTFVCRCSGVYGMFLPEALIWSLFLSFKGLRHRSHDEVLGTVAQNSNQLFSFDIEQVIWSSMPLCYKNLKLLKIPKPKPKKNRIRIVGTNIIYNERLKYYWALCVEGGEKLICVQHGGGSGRVKINTFDSEIAMKQYGFITWGWSKQENNLGNNIPLSYPLLSKSNGQHKEKNDKLILVGTIARFFSRNLQTAGSQPLQCLDYRKNKLAFIKRLPAAIFNNTIYRPYPNNYGALEDHSHVTKVFPAISICEGPLHPQILRCRLLVLDNLGTTFELALAWNIPVIVFNISHWKMSRQAQPFIDSFISEGIIFENGEDAAEKVEQIWDNVQEWWAQPSIQKNRKDYCYNYARASKSWRLEWIKALWNL